MSYNFDIKEFPPFYGPMVIPEGTVLYRGFCIDYPVISDRPSYYSFTDNIAEGYAKAHRCRLGIFRVKTPIRLYDLRYISKILMDIFIQRKNNTQIAIDACKALALSYGTCSYNKQLELVKERYPCSCNKPDCDKCERYKSLMDFSKTLKESDIIQCQQTVGTAEPALDATPKGVPLHGFITGVNLVEPQGVRIAETENDIVSGLLLKHLFETMVNGYVAPRMFSPYHTEKTGYLHNPELLLFNVERDDLLEEIKPIDVKIKKTLEWDHWKNSVNEVHFRMEGFIDPTVFINMRGGAKRGNKQVHPNYIIDSEVERMKELDEFARRAIDELVNPITLLEETPKYRELFISDW